VEPFARHVRQSVSLTVKLGSILLAGLFAVVSQAQATSETITILGAVQRPGVYALTPGRPVSLLTLYARAGGATKKARRKVVTITRTMNVPQAGIPAQTEMIQVNLDLILTGKANDIELKRGDVINVPSSEDTNKDQKNDPVLIAG
jgi:protein involved in polysaccharide export with SLBB domain